MASAAAAVTAGSCPRHIIGIAFFILLLIIFPASGDAALNGCFTRMFVFGDSISDTGNYAYLSRGLNLSSPSNRLPYGETFFHRPTGRFSDGRLVVDFLAEAFGLPFLPPSQTGNTVDDCKYGANFAVSGATAMVSEFTVGGWNSLGSQIKWFTDVLHILCHSKSDCRDVLESSLFFVEIGGNDYNGPLLSASQYSIEELHAIVLPVVQTIGSAVAHFISLGAKLLVVAGNLPIGCVPSYLTKYQSNKEEDYDPVTGCLKWMNDFSEYHNDLLKSELDRLRKAHPHATIIYADYYAAMMEGYLHPARYGFAHPLQTCCGTDDGPYKCSLAVHCGATGTQVCDDPLRYASWDGLHWTEAAYNLLAQGLLRGPHLHPPLAASCLNLQLRAGSVASFMSAYDTK